MKYLRLVVDVLGFKFDDVFVIALALIIGLVLASRISNQDNTKKIIGVGILLGSLGVERLLPLILGSKMNSKSYVVVCLICFACRVGAILVAFNFFAKYSAARWVYGIIGVLLVVTLFTSIYYGKVKYGLGSVSGDSDTGFLVLMALMNNKKAINTMTILCNLMPAGAIFIDALSSTSKR